MAQISYENFQMDKEARESRANTPRVGYFALKNDGDEAIVRFMHNSPADFDIMYVHPVQINGRFRNVNCIRNPKDPIEKCPLCEAKQKLQTKVFFHLLEYSKDEHGNIVATPKIWERSMSYIATLKGLCDEYAPLSENLFKIKRYGAAGSMDTSYQIMLASPNIYKSEMYPKDDKAFENVKALGISVMNKTYEQICDMMNGEQPAPKAVEPRPVVIDSKPQPTRSYDPSTVYANQSSEMSFNRPKRLSE